MFFLFQTTGILNLRDLQLIAPELIITITACLALVMEVILPYKLSKWTAYFSLAGIALALVSLGAQFTSMGGTFHFNSEPSLTPADGIYGMVHIDGFALVFRAIFLLAAALAIAISIRYLDIEREQHGEYYALILFATVGMMFLGSGYDLISLYIALELMALTFYVLVAFTKRERRSNEAGMKYFLLGAFSSGILLYGMSIVYGLTGSTNLAEIGRSLNNIGDLRPLLLIGMIALAAGLFFKVAAVTIVVGNWAAITQENSKRLLAYSSISNAGYLLLGIIANNSYGNVGLVIYLVVYTLMNMGAFGVIIS